MISFCKPLEIKLFSFYYRYKSHCAPFRPPVAFAADRATENDNIKPFTGALISASYRLHCELNYLVIFIA